MASQFQFSSTLRNDEVAEIQAAVGSSGVLKIWSGAIPTNCAAADPSGLLVTITLPSTFLTSSAGVTTLSGTWSASASGTGTAACFRIYDGSANCHVQGTVGTSGADLNLNNTSITSGQTVSITSFAVTEGNA
jgi:hypothetical protein